MASNAAEEKKDRTKLRHELFCQYFTKNESLFGNATLCYAEAYDYKLDALSHEGKWDKKGKLIEASEYDKAYNVCSVEGHRLLRMPKLQDRITLLLNEILRDDVVDSQLAKVIVQDGELRPKVAAIAEYNKLRGRITERQKHSFEGISDETLAERAAEIIAGIVSDQSGARDKKQGK